MAESSNPTHILSPLELIPKEEPDTQDRPNSPNPFLLVDQVEFTFDEITFNTNNEVTLLYPSHSQSEYFKVVSDFISKCCLKEAFTRAPNQYVKYLAEFWYTTKTLEDNKIWVSTPIWGIRGEINVTTFRNALRANYLSHSGGKTCRHDQISNKDAIILYYLANGVEIDFAKVIWDDIIHKLDKKSREKVVPYPQFISILLEYMMPEYENDELTLNPTQVFSVHNVPVESQVPKTSSKVKKKVSKGKKLGARSGLKRKQSSKHTNPSQPSVSIPVDTDLHKEDQQAAGGPTSLGDTSKEGAHPHLSSGSRSGAALNPIRLLIIVSNGSMTDLLLLADLGSWTNPIILVDKTKSAGDGLKTTHTGLGINEESNSAKISKTIKLEDLSKMMKDVQTDFMDLDSPEDEPIFVQDENEEEEEADKDEDTHATSHEETEDPSVPYPPSPKTLEQQKAKAEAEVALLTAKPAYPNVDQLSQFLVNSIKPELSKLLSSYGFSSFIPSELKELSSKINWEFPAKFLALPSQVSSVQAKLKTLDALPSLLKKVTNTLNMFAHIMETASPKAKDKGVPSAGQVGASLAEGEKNTYQASISQLFQRKIAKDTTKANLKQKPTTTTPPTTSSFKSPFFPSPPRSTP
ncbi:hypothetical protein Tco_0823768 [Tanacetum coccineum]|uniref:Uncharacterized protein n=1 Tax=Tanacetum coccineum TaxID=301880 RepID=A0ABQ5AKL9_9ASTR